MKILTDLLQKSNGCYIHQIEVNSVSDLLSELLSTINNLSDQYSEQEIDDFITSLAIISTNPENDAEIKNFDIKEYLKRFHQTEIY